MLTDLRHAIRRFTRCRGFALGVVTMLALGIGATTAIFSIVDAAVLRPLPHADPDRLVAFRFDTPRGRSDGAAARAFLDWREHQEAFDSLCAAAGFALVVTSGGEPEQLRPARVTADFFATYRVQPVLGKVFGFDAEQPGRDRVVLLGHRFWERRFGRDPNVVGRMLVTDRGNYEIVGVLPKDFVFGRTELFVPLAFTDKDRQHGVVQSAFLDVVGRLEAGVTIEQAAAHMNVLSSRFEDRRADFNKGSRIVLLPLHQTVTGAARSWMLMLLGSVAFVLLIACINVAGLFLAHGADRLRELTLRSALGAAPWRLARQMFVETLLVAACGAVLGLATAWWSIEVLRSAIPSTVPRAGAVGIDVRVLAFTVMTTLVTALICGLVPALSCTRIDVADGLRDGSRSTTPGRWRRRLGQLLAFAEIAAALVLVVGAGLFIRSFARVMTLHPGFDTSNLYAMDVQFPTALPEASRPDAAADLVRAVASVPGVAGAAAGDARPFSVSSMKAPVAVEGDAPGTNRGNIIFRRVTPEYLSVLRVPLRIGRALNDGDTASAPAVAVINESAARRLFPDANPLGRRLILRDLSPTVVGVVADARGLGRERLPEPELYVPAAQHKLWAGVTLTVRLTGRDDRTIAAVKRRVLEMSPGRPVMSVESVDETARRSAAPRRFNMLLLTIFGVVALGIAATGTYSLMAYTVRQRTQEIGVRMALGARARDVAMMLLRQGAMVVALGVAGGLAAAWLLARTVQAFLFEIEARDPIAFGAAALVLAVAGIVACWLPARRAMRVDPVIALRAE